MFCEEGTLLRNNLLYYYSLLLVNLWPNMIFTGRQRGEKKNLKKKKVFTTLLGDYLFIYFLRFVVNNFYFTKKNPLKKGL